MKKVMKDLSKLNASFFIKEKSSIQKRKIQGDITPPFSSQPKYNVPTYKILGKKGKNKNGKVM